MAAPVANRESPFDPRVLAQRASAGDREAFAQLYRLYLPNVRKVVTLRARPADVDDVIQEAFLRVWRQMPRFVWQGSGFVGLVVTTARNLCADEYKSARSRETFLVPPPGMGDGSHWTEVWDALVDDDRRADPADAVVADALAAELAKALAQLSSWEQIRAVTLRYLDEYSVEETAELMALTPSGVKSLCFRAMASLRRIEQRKPGAGS